ncbi:MAG: hypothetical protein M3Q97_01525 [Bacteroidota bacterium]|nr:hypothetical protein [Bacteroidota bacterium]
MRYAGWLAALALGAVVWLPRCGDPTPEKGCTVIDTFYLPGDTAWRDLSVKSAPEIIYSVSSERQFITDTQAILQRFLEKTVYADTISEDSNFLAVIIDTISENRIMHRHFLYRDLKPRMVVTKTITPTPQETPHLYLGGGLSFNKVLSAGITAGISTPHGRICYYSFDPILGSHSAGILWKVK